MALEYAVIITCWICISGAVIYLFMVYSPRGRWWAQELRPKLEYWRQELRELSKLQRELEQEIEDSKALREVMRQAWLAQHSSDRQTPDLNAYYEAQIYPTQHKPIVEQRFPRLGEATARHHRLTLVGFDAERLRRMLWRGRFVPHSILPPPPDHWPELVETLQRARFALTLPLGQPAKEVTPAALTPLAAPPRRLPPPLPVAALLERTLVKARPAPPADALKREQARLLKRYGSEQALWTHVLKRAYSPDEFEVFIARLWELDGYQIEQTRRGDDHGVDLIARKDDDCVAIVCRRYDEVEVASLLLRSVAAQRVRKSVKFNRCVLVTTSGFTKDALRDADEFGVELIGPDALYRQIKRVKHPPEISKLSMDAEA